MKKLLSLLLIGATALGFTPKMDNYGLIYPLQWKNKADYLNLLKSEPVPAHFDWREKLGKSVPILDQGNCGSCWAHSRVSTLAWQILIQTGQMKTFSRQELVSCDKEFYGCGGGFWSDYELSGISLEAEFPYTASNSRCKAGLPRGQKIDSWLYIGGKDRTPTKDEMKQAIFQYGPIGVTVSASGSFPNGCGNGQTNHMVVIVGWDDATGSWIVQNSWGTGFGQEGYAPVKYGCFRIGETAAVSILNVTPPVPVTFPLENASVSLSITVQPGSSYGVAGAKAAIQNTLNVVGN
jgi:C1A family cysteine protease